MTTSSNQVARALQFMTQLVDAAGQTVARIGITEIERLEKEHADKIVEITRNYDNELSAQKQAWALQSAALRRPSTSHIVGFEAGQRARAEAQKLEDELAGAKRTIETQQKALEHQGAEVRELRVLNSQLAGSALAGLLSRAFPDRYVYTPSGIIS